MSAIGLALLPLGGAGCRPPEMMAEGVAELDTEPVRTVQAFGWRRQGEPVLYRVPDGREVAVEFQVDGPPPNWSAGVGSGVRYTAGFRDADADAQLQCDFRHNWGGDAWRYKNYVWQLRCTMTGENPGTFEQGPCAARDPVTCEGVLRTDNAQYRYGRGRSDADEDVAWWGTWRLADGSLAQAAQVQLVAPVGLWTVQADDLGTDGDMLLLHAIVLNTMLLDL